MSAADVGEKALARVIVAMRLARGKAEKPWVVGYFNAEASQDNLRVLREAIRARQAGETGSAVLPSTCRIETVDDQDAIERMAAAALEEMKKIVIEESEKCPLVFARHTEPGKVYTIAQLWDRIDAAESLIAKASFVEVG